MKMFNSLFGMSERGVDLDELKKLSPSELKETIETKREALIKEFKLKGETDKIQIKDGATGLRNLGNTCFMNAVLQCLSNTEALTTLILSKSWVDQINSVSVAAEGRMVCVYFQFLKLMWEESHYSISPKAIKNTIVSVSRTFAGYSQQDSQEFLSYFLDALHEDLNSVPIKPYIVQPDYVDQDLNDFSREFWQCHIKRNNSPIVKLFHGQAYSRLTCPDCKYKSVTLDPFDMINLEIPKENSINFEGYLVSYTHKRDTASVKFRADASMCLEEALKIIVKNLDKDLSHKDFTCVFMFRSKIVDIVEDPKQMTIKQAMRNDNLLFIFETYSKEVKAIFNELDSGEKEEDKCFNRMNVYIDGETKGLERQYVLPLSSSVKQLYSFALMVYRRKLYMAKLKGSEELKSDEPAENIEGEFSLLFPNSTIDKATAPFYITINHEEVLDLDSTETKLLKQKFNTIKVVLNSDLLESTPRFKSAFRLTISYHKETQQDVYSCLDHFVAEEKLDADNTWYCSKCKDHKEAYKQMRIMKLPEVLVIHLKRFKKKHLRYGVNIYKNHDFIGTPFELDMSRYLINQDSKETKYELYGVVNHFGRCGGGHYTAFCKNFLDEQWYNFDDSDVEKIKQSDVPSKYAYVLFYKRKGN